MSRLTNSELIRKMNEMQQNQADIATGQDSDNVQTSTEILENLKNKDKQFNLHFARAITNNLFKPINDLWFRPKYVGFEKPLVRNNPKRPLIFASNHSGMAFPWDAIVFGYNYNEKVNYDKTSIRALSSPMLSFSKFMNPFQLEELWHRVGAVDATFQNFETMMYQEDAHVLIYPEGVPGIGKGFDKKYQLQTFRTSFVKMSVKYKTEIHPVHTINAEYIDPYTYSSKTVNKWVNKVGIPFLPLGPITLLLLLQPWVFYIAFPAQLTFVKGKALRPWEWLEKPESELTNEDFTQLAEKVRTRMQAEMNEAVKQYGQKPYDWGNLLKGLLKNWKLIPHVLPLSWPISFIEFDRRYQNGEIDVKLKVTPLRLLYWMIRNPLSFAFFIPILGYIPLAINGYRGNKISKAPAHHRVVK